MPFSPRRILAKQQQIFNRTGTLIILWVRLYPNTSPTYVPGNLFSANEDPVEDISNFRQQYIRGKFQEMDIEDSDGPGRRRYVKGIITVPMLYKDILANAEYIDPYRDGSRFIKDGNSAPDEERLWITQGIKLLSATSPSEIV